VFDAECLLEGSGIRGQEIARVHIGVTHGKEYGDASKSFRDYLAGKVQNGVRPFREFNLDTANFDEFFAEEIEELNSVYISHQDTTGDSDFEFVFEMDQIAPRTFVAGERYFSRGSSKSVVAKTREAHNAAQIEAVAHPKDFRPWVHRILEVAAGTPRNEWHDPAMLII
jgi:hypothetical protein